MKDLLLDIFSHNSSQCSVLDWHDHELGIIVYWKVASGLCTITKTNLDSIPQAPARRSTYSYANQLKSHITIHTDFRCLGGFLL